MKNKKYTRSLSLILCTALLMCQTPITASAKNFTPVEGAIVSFEPLDIDVANQSVLLGTEEAELNLPDELTVIMYHVTEDEIIPDDEITEDETNAASPSDAEGNMPGNDEKTFTTVTTSKEQIPVTWDSNPTYDGDVKGSYVFTPDVGGYTFANNVEPPQITVMVMENAEERPCTRTSGCTLPDGHEGECVLPPAADNALVKTITGWTFVDDDNLSEGELSLPGVSMENQADFDTVVSMLPTQISAEIKGTIGETLLDLTWSCPEYKQDTGENWPITGEYTFTAALPEGYACDQPPTVNVILGGGNAYAANNTITESGITIAASNGGEVTYTDGSGFVLSKDGDYVISGEWTGMLDADSDEKGAVITVASGRNVNVTFQGVTIDTYQKESGQGYLCAFDMTGSIVTLTLAGGFKNLLNSGGARAGLEVPYGAELIITGTGELEATGKGAGIGGGSSDNAGKITIIGGMVTATGSEGAGIGGGKVNGGTSGEITISGGTVMAKSIGQGAGIGGGKGGSNSKIIISGGTVVAESSLGVGIGGGSNASASGASGGSGGTIIISGSETSVTAKSALSKGFDVGNGIGTTQGSGGSLSVTGGATLEMQGNGTNIANPTYKGCTIIDKEGRQTYYNEEGKSLYVTALTLEVDPAGSQTYPAEAKLTVTLTGADRNVGKYIILTLDGEDTLPLPLNSQGVLSLSLNALKPGKHTFGARFEEDSENKAAKAADISYTVNPGVQEALILNGLDGSYTYGDSAFQLSTSGGTGNGTVSYASSDTSVADVSDNTVTIKKAGTFSITATKAADDCYKATSVTSGTVTVNQVTPNVSLTATGGGSAGNPIVLTAAVSKVGTGAIPAGTVAFKDGSNILAANVALDDSGVAAYTIDNPSTGRHIYTAEYPGQVGCYNQNSASQAIGEGLIDQTGFSITLPGAKTYGDSGFKLVATGGQSTGDVSFFVPADNGVLTVTADGNAMIIGVGSVTVTATKAADNNYNQATDTLEITVNPRDISNVTVNVTGSRLYTGSQLQIDFEVADRGIAINTGDYTYSYGSNTDVGTDAGSISLNGQHNYTGTKTVRFDIEKRSLNGAAIVLEASSYTHTGSEIKPAIKSVTVDGISVPAAAYDVSYANNKDKGTATVTIAAKADGNFTDTASTYFTITGSSGSNTGGGSSSGSSSGTRRNTGSTTVQTLKWILDEKGWRLKNPDQTWVMNGWKEVNGIWYHFNEEGYMQTGWFTDLDGNKYYLSPAEGSTQGGMVVGWQLIENKWYYFNMVSDGTKGRLLFNTVTPDGYTVGTDGVWNS